MCVQLKCSSIKTTTLVEFLVLHNSNFINETQLLSESWKLQNRCKNIYNVARKVQYMCRNYIIYNVGATFMQRYIRHKKTSTLVQHYCIKKN